MMRYQYFFLSFSGLLFAASIAALLLWGLRLGIDFTGGSLMEMEFSGNRPAMEEIRAALDPLGLGGVAVQPTGERGALLRFRDVDEATHQNILAALRTAAEKSGGGTRGHGDTGTSTVRSTPGNVGSGTVEKRFDAIGPVIGRELRDRAIWALLLTIVVIIAYIAWAFRHISEPVASWKYGVAAIVALLHDIAIPAGVFATLGYFKGVEIDVLFITALLTILGFSVHDTIVVFDRIRENLRNLKRSESYRETVERSTRETIARSILTSLTVLFVLAAVYAFGGVSTRHFTLALIVGVVAGVYSSIFVASPLLVLWHSLTKK